MVELSEQDLSEIKELHDAWIAKEVAGIGSEVVNLCTDDVQLLPPDAPPISGKEEIEKYLAANQVKLMTVDTTNLSIRGSESLAYLTSNFLTRFSPDDQTAIVHEVRGTHLWILRKESNNWRVALVTWSSWQLQTLPS